MSTTDPQESTNIPTFHIAPDGWGKCDQCSFMTKGLNAPATARLMALHVLHKHHIKVDVNGDVINTDHDEYATPTFIEPRRNGTAVTTPTRMDWGGRKGYGGRFAI